MSLLADGWFPCTVQIWDLASRKALLTLDKLSGLIRVPVLSPDGKYLAMPIYLTSVVRVVDAATGREVYSCKGDRGFLAHAIFSPDGKSLAASGQRGVCIWDVTTHEKRLSLQSAAHQGLVLACSPDSKRLAMGSLEGLIELWDIGTGQLIDTFKGHGGEIRSIAITLDGTRLASAGADGTLRVWDAAGRGRVIPTLKNQSQFGRLDLSPDGQTILAETLPDQRYQLMDAVTGISRGEPIDSLGGRLSFDWTADGKRLIAAGRGKKLAILEAGTGVLVRSFEVDREGICQTALSPDGQWCAHSGPAGAIKVLRADTGALHRSISGTAGTVENLTFNRDGARLAASGNDGWVKIWDIATGRKTMVIRVSDIYMGQIRFRNYPRTQEIITILVKLVLVLGFSDSFLAPMANCWPLWATTPCFAAAKRAFWILSPAARSRGFVATRSWWRTWRSTPMENV